MTSSPDRDESNQLPFRYDATMANEIEPAWQARWEADGTFQAPNPVGPLSAGFSRAAGRPKFYVLDFFPYPSGAGLHVGHPLGYIATDVLARFLRMTGHTVLHTTGYDAFGLPAEQYAISTDQHPAVSTSRNIDTMRWQLRRLGLGYDTRREFSTTDPRFYRWTQWIFLQIFNSWFDEGQGRARPITELIAEFEAGTRTPAGEANPGGKPWAELDELARRRVADGWRLAYLAEGMVNWAPGLGTVLANEEVTADGRSDVGNYPVYRRPLRQWMLRITAYAERLLADLDRLDWPEPVKQQQRNWIGPSDGAVITFPVVNSPVVNSPVVNSPVVNSPVVNSNCQPGRPARRGLHHQAGHAARRDLPGPGPGSSAGRGAGRRPVAARHPAVVAVCRRAGGGGRPAACGRGTRVPGARRQARRPAAGRFGAPDRGVHRQLRDESRHRRPDPGVPRRLRADGLRHRGHHGRPRARRA